MKTTSQSNWKVQAAFASAIFTLLAVGAICYRSLAVSSDSDRWVRHTHEVLENLEDLLFAMESVESSGRGFVLSDDDSYLEARSAGVLRVQQDQATLGSLTGDNSTQQRQLLVLAKLVGAKISRGDFVIGLRKTRGLAATVAVAQSGTGQRIMNDFQ